jgi:hypothetical protein
VSIPLFDCVGLLSSTPSDVRRNDAGRNFIGEMASPASPASSDGGDDIPSEVENA